MSQLNLDECEYYPLGERVLIEVIDPEKNPNSMIVMLKTDKGMFPQFGRVVRVGPKVENPPNACEWAKIKPGALVSFSRHSAVSSVINLKDEKQFILLTQGEIQSVLVPRLPLVAANDSGTPLETTVQ